MELQPLFQGIVHHLHHVHRGNGLGTHHVFPVVFVILQLSPHQQRHTAFQLIQGLALPGVLNDLQGDGASVVGDVNGIDFPGLVSGLLALHGKDFPPHHNDTHIQRRLPQRGGLALGNRAQHGSCCLGDDSGQQMLLVPDADLAAAGPLLQSLLVLLHLPHLGLPLAADLLCAGLLHRHALSGLHGKASHKLH